MRNAKRAVDAIAVLNRYVHLVSLILIVALLAEIVGAKAAEEGHAAAELAFPVNLGLAMLFANGLSCSDFLQKTVLATEILLRDLALSHVSKLLLAVYQATKVRFLTLVALINGAAMVSELLWLSEEVVSDRC